MALAPFCKELDMKAALGRLLLLGVMSWVLIQPAWGQAPAGEVPPAWRALPAETVVAVQLPGATAFAEALQTRTRLGQLLLSPQRRDAVAQMLQQADPESWQKFVQHMQRYRVTMDDLPRLFAGAAGVALVIEPRQDRQPLALILGWLEPGEDLGQRIIAAMAMAAEDLGDDQSPIQRVEFDLAGQRVMHLRIPETGSLNDMDLDEQPDWQNMDQQAIQRHFEQQAAREWKWGVVDQTNLLVTRVGGRLLVALAPPQSGDQARPLLNQEQAIDWDRVTDMERVTTVLGRFITEQSRGQGEFARQVQATPGVAAALGTEGLPLYELYVSTQPVVRLLQDQAGGEVDVRALLQNLGLDTLTAVVGRGVLQGQILRNEMFVTAPQPRRGILAMLDQSPLAPEPEPWVSAEAASYVHVSADLGRIYTTIKEAVIAQVGAEAAEGFAQMEMQVQAMLQMSLADVLSSLGQRHVMLGYDAGWVEAEVPDMDNFNPETGEFAMKMQRMPQNRMAYVWQLRNEQVWRQIMQMIGGFAPMFGGMIQPTEEQGFTGYRIEGEGVPVQGGVFLGHGRLVIAVGQEVAEPLLASIRNPPAGAAALRTSPLFTDATRRLTLRPGVMFNYTDMRRAGADARRMISWALEQADIIDAQQLERLLPSDEEMREALATDIGQAYFTDEGLVTQNAMELPPAR
jgi:hypothetical protein